MKVPLRLLFLLCFGVALLASGLAANPFLSAPDDKPVSAKFKGTEWGDDVGGKELPLTARLVTTRIAQAPWGAVFKISFEDIVSRAENKREISPVYYIVTDDQIVRFNEEKPEEAAQKLIADPKAPTIDPVDVEGILKGTSKMSDKLTETNITVKGNTCTYLWSHNSGHFRKVVWQKGVGVIEFAMGYGAERDGFRLKREGGGSKGKH